MFLMDASFVIITILTGVHTGMPTILVLSLNGIPINNQLPVKVNIYCVKLGVGKL